MIELGLRIKEVIFSPTDSGYISPVDVYSETYSGDVVNIPYIAYGNILGDYIPIVLN